MITINEAIETLRTAIAYQDWPELTQLNQAQQLGIEALKREQLLRHEIPYDRDGLLPGESEE